VTAPAQRDLFSLFGVTRPRGQSDERLSIERAVTLAELEAARAGVEPSLPAPDMSVAQVPVQRRSNRQKPVADLAALRAFVKDGTQDRPGTYRFLGSEGEVLYIGKSKQLRTRLLSYFRAVWPHDKGARILWRAARIEWTYEPSEFAALLRELRLIKQLRPRYNWMMKRDARHYCFVKVTGGAAPKLTVTRGASGDDGGTYYGPYLSAGRVGAALRELSDVLGLRDCANDVRMHFSDQRELPVLLPVRTPQCIRHEIGTCLGPCIGAAAASEYATQVQRARDFLEGTTDAPLADLTARILAHSEALEFERAAALHDKHQRIESLRAQFEKLRFAVESLTFAYPVTGHGGEQRVYLIRRGTVRADLPVPTSARARLEFTEWHRRVFDGHQHDPRGVSTHEVDELLLLSSWFQQHPEELAATIAPMRVLSAFGV
jgi:excinuclease ABC subunit C